MYIFWNKILYSSLSLSLSLSQLAELINGKFKEISTFKIIDCRYPYEYEGGHIQVSVALLVCSKYSDICCALLIIVCVQYNCSCVVNLCHVGGGLPCVCVCVCVTTKLVFKLNYLKIYKQVQLSNLAISEKK